MKREEELTTNPLDDKTLLRNELLRQFTAEPEQAEVELKLYEWEAEAWKEGNSVGRFEEHMRSYIDTTSLWKELYQAVTAFVQSKSKSHITTEEVIIEELTYLQKPILCQCQPRKMPVPYCDIKRIGKHRYKLVKNEKARSINRRDRAAYAVQSKYTSINNTARILKALSFVLRKCEEGWGIKPEKSNVYDEDFWAILGDEVNAEVVTRVEIDLNKMSKTPSRRLLKDLIRTPAGVDNDKYKYGKQPTGVKDLLKRHGYGFAASHIHQRKTKIVVSEKIMLIEKK